MAILFDLSRFIAQANLLITSRVNQFKLGFIAQHPARLGIFSAKLQRSPILLTLTVKLLKFWAISHLCDPFKLILYLVGFDFVCPFIFFRRMISNSYRESNLQRSEVAIGVISYDERGCFSLQTNQNTNQHSISNCIVETAYIIITKIATVPILTKIPSLFHLASWLLIPCHKISYLANIFFQAICSYLLFFTRSSSFVFSKNDDVIKRFGLRPPPIVLWRDYRVFIIWGGKNNKMFARTHFYQSS